MLWIAAILLPFLLAWWTRNTGRSVSIALLIAGLAISAYYLWVDPVFGSFPALVLGGTVLIRAIIRKGQSAPPPAIATEDIIEAIRRDHASDLDAVCLEIARKLWTPEFAVQPEDIKRTLAPYLAAKRQPDEFQRWLHDLRALVAVNALNAEAAAYVRMMESGDEEQHRRYVEWKLDRIAQEQGRSKHAPPMVDAYGEPK